MIKIDYDTCCWKDGKCVSACCAESGTKCDGCVEACPSGALERKDLVVYYEDKCTDCGLCVSACKYNAISDAG